MANFTAADVKKLRELTAAGMMDCKNALVEAEGDLDKAVEILRVKGQKGVTKREGRSASNGAIVSLIADDNTEGVLVELKCETDFVAKGDKFVVVADTIAAHVAATKPAGLEALLGSELRPGQTVQAFVDEANATLGEKIVLDRFAQFTGGYVTSYLHRTSPDLPPQVGVLVELDKADPQTAKDVAQHIAAFSPKFLTRDEIDTDTVETSAGSPRPPPARRASPRPPCRGSSRAGSTASSRRTSSWSSRSRRTPRRPFRRCSTRPASRSSASPASASASDRVREPGASGSE